MKTRIIIPVMFIALLMLAAGTAFAGRGMGHGNMGQGCQQGISANCPNFNNVNLTDEQKTKLEAERTRFWNETSEIRTQINAKEAEMKAEMLKTEVNRETVQNIQSQISALEADFNKLKADHLINMRSISPELAQQCANFGGGCGKMGACMGMGQGMNKGMGKGMGMGNMMNCPSATQNQTNTQN